MAVELCILAGNSGKHGILVWLSGLGHCFFSMLHAG